jgi:hypothetical protein
MAAAPLSRASVLDIIRRASNALRAERAGPDDEAAVSRALANACGAKGVAPEAFDRTVGADPDLYQLKNDALREAFSGTADPGPYGSISRESPSGQPGDTTKSRTNPEPDPSLSSWDPTLPPSRRP